MSCKVGKENPKLKIILKGKTGVHKKCQFNISFFQIILLIESGPGEKFLEDAVVIAFGSNIVEQLQVIEI